MILKVPSYYEKFHCIADQCKDNCCYGWEIDIDEGTMDYYRSLGGELGKEITSHIREGEENTMIMREDGYCPFLNEKKLCDICIKMGEEALSEICTEFPRFTMEYEDVREKILSLACEEVGNIMFSTDEKITWQELTTGVEIYEPATSLLVETGDWRVDVPVFKEDKCKQCLLCVPFCPDSSIPVKDGKRLDFDFKHCKGCGICVEVCPFDAIDFVKEEK